MTGNTLRTIPFFPISFPIHDIIESLHNKNTFDFKSVFKTVIKKDEYVHLNIDKPSTVIQVKWLNTMKSNPIYYKINKI